MKDNNKKYVVMLFDTEINLNKGNKPNTWINYENHFYDNPIEALHKYINTDCNYPQLIKVENNQNINQLMTQMINNFNDNKWIIENIFN